MARNMAGVYLVTIILIIHDIDFSVRADYTLDDSVGLGRPFDGIGGLSAGVSLLRVGPRCI